MGIKTARDRNALPCRREPYWHALGTGQHLGFRKSEDGGSWIARSYDPGTQKRVYHAIGDLAPKLPSEQFDIARTIAEEWFKHLGKGGRTETITVGEACARYVKHVRAEKGGDPAKDAEGRLRRHVLSDAIASVPIDKLAARHVKEWRKRLAETPAARPKRGKKCRVKTPPPPPKPRSGMAINRDMVALRAALNLALRDNYVVTDAAWREALKPIEGANERRTAYLSLDQRRELVKQVAHDDLRQFVRGMCLLPLRPGALAALTVANFDSRSGALTVKTDKAGAGRVILLPTTAADLLRECAKGKLPAAPLFARWDGSAWHRDAWKKGIGAAAAKIGAKATAYTLRHSVITDLVVDQALDLFTVAALSGTSVVMIEKHYGHLRQDRAQQALAGLAL